MKTLKVPVRDEFYEEIREEAHSRRISMAEVLRGRLALAEGLRFPKIGPLPDSMVGEHAKLSAKVDETIKSMRAAGREDDLRRMYPKTVRDVIKERLG